MVRLSIKTLAAICAISVAFPAVGGSTPEPGRRTVVLFGATWCAPCMVELRDIARLAAAAAPDGLVVVWDEREKIRDRLTGIANVHLASDAEMNEIGAIVGDGKIGLPYAMMRGTDGRKCAEWNGPLHPADIARLRARCGAG